MEFEEFVCKLVSKNSMRFNAIEILELIARSKSINKEDLLKKGVETEEIEFLEILHLIELDPDNKVSLTNEGFTILESFKSLKRVFEVIFTPKPRQAIFTFPPEVRGVVVTLDQIIKDANDYIRKIEFAKVMLEELKEAGYNIDDSDIKPLIDVQKILENMVNQVGKVMNSLKSDTFT